MSRHPWLLALVACMLLLLSALPASARALTLSVGVDRNAFSPNGDGRGDAVIATVRSSDPAAQPSVMVTDAGGTIVRSLASTTDAPATFAWDGLDDAGRPALDGVYTLQASAIDAASGAAITASAAVVVDTVAPTFVWSDVAPSLLTGPGDVRFSFAIGDEATPGTTSPLGLHVAYTVLDTTGARVARVGVGAQQPGDHDVGWSAITATGPANGLDRVRFSVSDVAGNLVTSDERTFRVQRPVTSTVIRRVENTGRRVALTFDDCTDPKAWSRLLDTLRAAGAGSTFFCAGTSLAAYPDLARRTVDLGVPIGNHTWSHPDLTTLGATEIRAQLTRNANEWWRLAATTPVPYFRPPYDAFNDRVVRIAGELGYRWTVLWDVDPRDWSGISAGEITTRVLSAIRPGSIVVMHTKSSTAAALPAILDGLKARRLVPVSVPELLRSGGLS